MIRFSHKFRSFLIAVILIGGLASLLVRLFCLQVVWHEFFSEKAARQQRLSMIFQPRRGKILDCKNRDLAMSIPVKSFYAVPGEIESVPDTARKLARTLHVEERDLREKLVRRKSFVWIKRKVGEEEASDVVRMNLRGVYFLEESKRFYPGGLLLSHVLGFTDLDERGLEGLERQFDHYLRGKPGFRLTERDATGREILTARRHNVEPMDGMNLILTIDAAVQALAEAQLDEVVKKFQPASATIIVMNPFTGEILALANRPAFDPNRAGAYLPEVRRNRAVTDFFEPGSTFKPFIASAALEEKRVTLEDRFYCEQGAFKVSGHTLHDVHAYGTLSVQDIITKSSNIGMAKIGYRLGPEKLYAYMKRFGFGNISGIELPGEVTGWVHPVRRWSKLTPYMVSMGQELTATALQMTRAYCALANGGHLVHPHLVRQVEDPSGRVIYQAKTDPSQRILSQKTAQMIIEAMKGVVSSEGTGGNAQVEGYSVAGKTGTAQKVNPGGGYSHSKFVSSFIGFIPADTPRTVISVVVNEPQRYHYGGTVAAPAFKQLAGDLMRYLEVKPDRMVALSKTEGE